MTRQYLLTSTIRSSAPDAFESMGVVRLGAGRIGARIVGGDAAGGRAP